MRKIIFFLYFIVSISAVSLDELQALMVNKQYAVHGIFYKYDFANVESAWDFVYVANNVYYQLKGVQAKNNNVFGWKIIDALTVSSPSFYFIYLADVDEDNITKYDWVAVDKTNSTINKLIGSTSSGYFSWSENLNKLSFSFNEGNKKVTFHKAIDSGSSLGDSQLPKIPDLPDGLPDVNGNNSGNNGNNSGSNGNNNGNNSGNNSGSGSSGNNNGSNGSGSGNDNNTTSNSGNENNTTKKYEDDPNCNSYIKYDPKDDSPPATGVCYEKDRKEIK